MIDIGRLAWPGNPPARPIHKTPILLKNYRREKPASTDSAVKPDFLVRVVDLNGNPVAGAKVTPDWYSYQNARNLSGSIEPDDAAPAITDANGLCGTLCLKWTSVICTRKR